MTLYQGQRGEKEGRARRGKRWEGEAKGTIQHPAHAGGIDRRGRLQGVQGEQDGLRRNNGEHAGGWGAPALSATDGHDYIRTRGGEVAGEVGERVVEK